MLNLTLATETDGQLSPASRERIRSAIATQLGVTGAAGKAIADRIAREVNERAAHELRAGQLSRDLSRALKMWRAGAKNQLAPE